MIIFTYFFTPYYKRLFKILRKTGRAFDKIYLCFNYLCTNSNHIPLYVYKLLTYLQSNYSTAILLCILISRYLSRVVKNTYLS